MKIKDKELNELVDVCDRGCLKKDCYWPRPDPGIFTQGVGYLSRQDNGGKILGYAERGKPEVARVQKTWRQIMAQLILVEHSLLNKGK